MEWFSERTKNTIISHRVEKSVLSTRSKYQKIDIRDTFEFGRMLYLDHLAQSSEVDEFIYHEMLVHPALFSHHPVKKVCIIGGAEGATLREVLRHEVDRVVMVDIDEELVAICREYLPAWSKGSFDDPRLELHFQDGRRFIEQTEELFDAIILDLSDPMEDGPSTFLYTAEFYTLVNAHLSEHGCVALQSESLGLRRIIPHARIYNTLKSIFPFVRPYPYMCPCYHEYFSFTIASKCKDPARVDIQPVFEKKNLSLRYYSPEVHKGIFKLPNYVYEAYKIHSTLISDKDVVYYPAAGR